MQKAKEGEEDCYSELVAKITSIVQPISIPCMTSDLKDATEGGSKSYFELNVKRTISRPKSKGKVNH